MSSTATEVDEIWSWIYQPLQDLKQDLAADPDKPWEAAREFFLEKLGLTDPAQHPVTELLIYRLEELPEAERHNMLRSDELDTLAYEVVQECASGGGQETAADPDAYDETAWHEFLAANLPAWNGAEDSWQQFKEWFLYQAGEQGVNSPATALADHLDGMSNDERIATCAQYGVTIEPADQPAQPTDDEAVRSLMEETLAERPELARIPEERRLQLLADLVSRESNAAPATEQN